MYTKLTLNVSESAVRKAKRYSRRKKVSVSKMVQNYFEQLDPVSSKKIKRTSIARKLLGIAEGAIPQDMSYKEAIAKMYESKAARQ